jgi:hypothetical protein
MEEKKDENKSLKEEIQSKTVEYLIAAFGLVAGLAWNDAVKSLIDYLFPLTKNTLLAKFIYAIIITIIVVILSNRFISLIKKSSIKEDNKSN